VKNSKASNFNKKTRCLFFKISTDQNLLNILQLKDKKGRENDRSCHFFEAHSSSGCYINFTFTLTKKSAGETQNECPEDESDVKFVFGHEEGHSEKQKNDGLAYGAEKQKIINFTFLL